MGEHSLQTAHNLFNFCSRPTKKSEGGSLNNTGRRGTETRQENRPNTCYKSKTKMAVAAATTVVGTATYFFAGGT
ncbi:hypothetical protein WA026_001897 [Henosepilachna vigintioctopunctata]|uniref:Uncharacterized protein n=1 Tax=Henosepilachna vigintioctopunctata TaxID=420089 RepID=A0AAW1URL5_9CUCU